MAQLLPLWHSCALGCARIRLLPAAWLASLPAGRAASQLFHCSSQLQSVEKPVPDPFPRACVTAVPQSRTWRGDNRHCCAGSMQVSSELDAVQIHR